MKSLMPLLILSLHLGAYAAVPQKAVSGKASPLDAVKEGHGETTNTNDVKIEKSIDVKEGHCVPRPTT